MDQGPVQRTRDQSVIRSSLQRCSAMRASFATRSASKSIADEDDVLLLLKRDMASF